jgi:hypothetical protein
MNKRKGFKTPLDVQAAEAMARANRIDQVIGIEESSRLRAERDALRAERDALLKVQKGLVEKWDERAKSIDARVGRAAALHNLSEYGNLRGQRDAIELCLQELRAALPRTEGDS